MAGNTAVRQPNEGDAFWMLGGLYEVKVSSEDTGGAMTVMQMTMPAGMGPPPHTHDGDEAVLVLSGRVRYSIDGQTFEAPQGTAVNLPAGVLESFDPLETTTIIAIYTPGGIERFFAEAGEPAQRREIPPTPSGPPDFERLATIAQKYGLKLEQPAAV